jgi:hypothetical protein
MEKDIPPFPFTGRYVLHEEAVEYILDTVYQHEHRNTARKRVRARIENALKTGKLSIKRRDKGDQLDATALFTWAAGTKGWSLLYRVPGIPILPSSGEASGSLGGMSVVASGFSTPTEPEDFERLYVETRRELFDLQRAYDSLKTRHASLVAEVEGYREQRAHRSKINAKNARQKRFE